MGAYENPRYIRDLSAQAYGTAITDFGKAIGGGILSYAASKKANEDAIEKEKLVNRGIWVDNEAEFDKLFQNDVKGYKDEEKNENLFIKWKDEAKGLLASAKKANYEIKTDKDLSDQDVADRMAVVDVYTNYMGAGETNIGSMYTDNEDAKKFNRNNYGVSQVPVGSGVTGTTNKWALLALANSNNAPAGVEYFTDVEVGSIGEAMVVANTKFTDETSSAWQSLTEEEKTHARDNDMTFKWKKDWGKWNAAGGFFRDIDTGLSDDVMTTLDLKNENGDINSTLLIEGGFRTEINKKDPITGKGSGRDVTTTTSLVNTPAMRQGLLSDSSNHAKLINGTYSIEDTNNFIAYTLKQKGNSFNRSTTILDSTLEGGTEYSEKFPNGRTYDELSKEVGAVESFFTNGIIDNTMQNNLGSSTKGQVGYTQRVATPQEIIAINTQNQNDPNFSGAKLIEGDQIWVSERTNEFGTKTVTPPSGGTDNANDKVIKFDKYITDTYFANNPDLTAVSLLSKLDENKTINNDVLKNFVNMDSDRWIAPATAGISETIRLKLAKEEVKRGKTLPKGTTAENVPLSSLSDEIQKQHKNQVKARMDEYKTMTGQGKVWSRYSNQPIEALMLKNQLGKYSVKTNSASGGFITGATGESPYTTKGYPTN
tara:strand:- start:8637 stop:10595 length:1959 start_codon:yes stop_codon:yes gene_type:complete